MIPTNLIGRKHSSHALTGACPGDPNSNFISTAQQRRTNLIRGQFIAFLEAAAQLTIPVQPQRIGNKKQRCDEGLSSSTREAAEGGPLSAP